MQVARQERIGAHVRTGRLDAVTRWAPPLVLGLLVVLAYARFTTASFVGTDTLSTVETSRATSLADLGTLWREPLMAGSTFVDTDALRYAPIVTLTFAIDHALWGLNPAGYHLTNLILQVAATVLAYILLREMTLQWPAAALGAAIVGLHPAMASAVPVLARRHDSVAAVALFGSFILLCVALRHGTSRPRLAMAGSLVLFGASLAAKESTFAALPLVPLTAAVVWRANPSLGRRGLKDYAVLTVTFGVVAAGLFAVRYAVLGGLGGHHGTQYDTFDIEAYRLIVDNYVTFLLWPFHQFYPERTVGWIALVAAIVPLVGLAFLALPSHYRLLVAVGAAWVASFGLLWIALRHLSGAWYLYYPLLGVGLILGATAEAMTPLVARGGSLRKLVVPMGMIVAVVVYSLGVLRTSALVERYPQWQSAGEIIDRYLAGAAMCTEEIPGGTAVTFWNAPKTFHDRTPESELLNISLFEHFSLKSYLRLVRPDREFDLYIGSSAVMDSVPPDWDIACGWGGPNRRRVVATSRWLPEPEFPTAVELAPRT